MKNKFIKRLRNNKYNISISISSKFSKNSNNIFFFGNPIHKNLEAISTKNIFKELKNIYGYFLIFFIKNKTIHFVTDPLGNFRCYYIKNGKNIIITNKFDFALKHSRKKINLNELLLWHNKSYTSGDSTLFKDIYKIPPTSIFKISSSLKAFNYINLFKNDKYLLKNHSLNVKESLIDGINEKINKKIILLFSGGLDSSALAKILKEKKANFDLVYLSTYPKTFESEKGLMLATLMAKNLKKNLKIIKVKWSLEKNFFNKIIINMMNEYHTSFVQFEGIKKILKIYGKNICIISGQSADSIFCFGASTNSLSHLTIRVLHNFSFLPFQFIIKKLLEIKYKVILRIPRNHVEKKIMFYDSFFYYPFQKKNIGNENYIKKKVLRLINKNKKNIFDYMKIKIFGFLQGPDNQVLINAANVNNFYDIYLPYSNFKIINSTCQYQSRLKSIFKPKYEVKEMLDKKTIMIYKNFKFINKKLIKISNLDHKIKDLFLKKIYEIKK